ISSPQTNSTSSTTVTSQTSSEVPTQEKASQTTQTSSAQLQTSNFKRKYYCTKSNVSKDIINLFCSNISPIN
ncbi:hypothetical protein, partial [Streptococcus pneumoniae]|uniref:hypothetical protein n=1 Tax=Streptococcus pneumoniae TaxID=1313 RepID=UPI001F3ED039